MTFRATIFCVFCLVSATVICAGQLPPLRYGRLHEKDTALTSYEGADAVILCDYGQYMFSNEKFGTVYFHYTRHLRIKILTEAGMRYATQQIPFYDLQSASYSIYSQSYSLRAQTLNVNAKGKIVESKVKFRNIDVTEPDEYFNARLTIHFPDVRPGSIIEYLITIPTFETVNPAPWMVQYDIPCLWNELRIITPVYFSFAIKPYNMEYSDVCEIKSIMTGISYPNMRRSGSYEAKQFQFIKTDIPSLPFSGNETDYNNSRMFVKFMLEFATQRQLLPGMSEIIKGMDPGYKYMKRSEKRTALLKSGYILYRRPDLKEITKDLNRSEQFGIPLILNLGFNDTLKKITGVYDTDEEKVMAIYHFVRDQLEWNKQYRILLDPGIPFFLIWLVDKITREPVKMNVTLKKVIDKGEGNNSEINGVLINMLRAAGFRARPVLVSTLNNTCYLDTSFFNLHQFNHMIAAVEVDGREILLDAVRKWEGTIMTADLMNEFGLLIELRRARWIKVADQHSVPPRDVFETDPEKSGQTWEGVGKRR